MKLAAGFLSVLKKKTKNLRIFRDLILSCPPVYLSITYLIQISPDPIPNDVNIVRIFLEVYLKNFIIEIFIQCREICLYLALLYALFCFYG